MVTDNERREVARRLRNEAKMPQPWIGFVFRDVMHAYPSEYKPTNECDDWEQRQHEKERDFINRLADLIEPSCDREALGVTREIELHTDTESMPACEHESVCGPCDDLEDPRGARGGEMTFLEKVLWVLLAPLVVLLIAVAVQFVAVLLILGPSILLSV